MMSSAGSPTPSSPGSPASQAGPLKSQQTDNQALNDFLDALEYEDPLEKIKKWEPAMPYESPIPRTQAEGIIGRVWEDPFKGKPIPVGSYWRKLKKAREEEPPIAEEPFRDFLHFERTPDDQRLVEFLITQLSQHSLQLQDFREFPYATEGVKNREVFDPEVGKMPMRKKQRMCWKLGAQTGLRGPQDILQLTDKDWVRGHMPLPFAFIKKRMLNYYYSDLSDLDRAALWKSVGETQRNIDHQRMLDFPLKVTPLPTNKDDASTPRAPESELKRYQLPPPAAYTGLYEKILHDEVEEWRKKSARTMGFEMSQGV